MIRSSAVLLLALASASCGETPVLRFQVDKDIPQQTIEGSLAPCQIPIEVPFLDQPFQMTFSQEQDFPEQNTDVQHIESAKLDTLTLTMSPASAETNWDFLDSLELYAEADGLPRALAASIDPVADGLTTLLMQPAGLELAPYVKAQGGFTLTSEATGCPPQSDAVFTGRVIVNITADPL